MARAISERTRASIAAAAALLVCSCGGDPARGSAPAAARSPERVPAETRGAPVASDDAPALRPAAGAPTVEQPRATYWADPIRGLVLRAERIPAASTRPEDAAWGDVTILARDRRAPGHLVREWDGDLYWVEYRRDDAACDFVRLASGAASPEILFTDSLGDFSESICETALAVEAGARHVFWLHGGEVRAVVPTRGASPVVLARDQPYPRELAVDDSHVYWLVIGADPYEDDTTGRGALRAAPIEGGPVITLLDGLTEPRGIVITGTHVEVRDAADDIHRSTLAGPPVTPG